MPFSALTSEILVLHLRISLQAEFTSPSNASQPPTRMEEILWIKTSKGRT
jgi:hypothetical protein